ncbi:MAG: hypothetical protein V9F82_05015 [Dermatophilaceae bacterium]
MTMNPTTDPSRCGFRLGCRITTVQFNLSEAELAKAGVVVHYPLPARTRPAETTARPVDPHLPIAS